MKASYQYLSNENKFSMWSQRNLHFIRYIEIKLYICIDIFFPFFRSHLGFVGRIILFIHNR